MAETNGNEPTRNEPALLNIEDDMRQSYLDYAMSVNIGRALPQIRDGLKPVHRRILYAMFRTGLLSNRRYTKCAAVVGEVLARYHPHGDMAVYDSLVRMAQPFSLRYLLIDGQEISGSVDGDPPAAYRYTECKLTRLRRADARRYRQGHGQTSSRTSTARTWSPTFCRRSFRICW